MVSALLFATVALQGEPRWALDGDAKDSSPAALHGKAAGRAAFVESPIGAAGQMLWLNGVDAFVQIDPPGALAAGDFTLALWFLPLEQRPATLAFRSDGKVGWGLDLLADGALRFEARVEGAAPAALQTPARSVLAGQWVHAVVAIRRAKAGTLFVNGAAVAQGAVPPGTLDPGGPLLLGKGSAAKPFHGMIDEVSLSPRALTPEEVATLTDRGLPWARHRPQAPFSGKFDLKPDDVVAFMGSEEARAAQDNAALETLLALSAPKSRVLFRTMAWEGDTVFEQWRILNFGPWERQLDRAGVSVIFSRFGQMESAQGRDVLPAFIEAYSKLLDEFAKRTPRIVLLSPIAFEKPEPPLPDLTRRNADVKLYADAIRELAQKRGFPFVDLYSMKKTERLTREGLHLTEAGHEAVARETARQLGLPADRPLDGPLRAGLQQANRLWSEHWRPTNWAFLAGDRMEQPSSRDHRDRNVRWFPMEIQKSLALLRQEEAKIQAILQAARE